jgi:hypothetical protein
MRRARRYALRGRRDQSPRQQNLVVGGLCTRQRLEQRDEVPVRVDAFSLQVCANENKSGHGSVFDSS